jgi:hypothetical protein
MKQAEELEAEALKTVRGPLQPLPEGDGDSGAAPAANPSGGDSGAAANGAAAMAARAKVMISSSQRRLHLLNSDAISCWSLFAGLAAMAK